MVSSVGVMWIFGRITARQVMTAAAAIGAVLAGATSATAPLAAQGYFKFQDYNYSPYGYSDPYYKPRKKKPRAVKAPKPAMPAKQEAGAKASPALEKSATGPLVITISIKKQRVAVFDAEGLVTEAPISSGRVGYSTPTGIYSILEKRKVHYSNLYDSAPMPNMQRITWSGVALHAGQLPGYPASHGCIRLPHGFSQKLFELTKPGMRVIVTSEPVVPEAFSHPRLFNAYPPDDQVTHAVLPAAETQIADASPAPGIATSPVGAVIGVTPAAASESTGAGPRVSPFRQAWKAEMARLAAVVTVSDIAKAEAAARAAETGKILDETKVLSKRVRTEFDRLSAEEKKARRALDASESQLEAFEKRLTKSSAFTPEATQKAAQDEDALEAKSLDLAEAVDDAAADVGDMKQALGLADKEVADADSKHRDSTGALANASQALEAAKAADGAAKRREAKRKNAIHVFVSRKTQKLYVRQGYEPILESPVTFAGADTAIGTHVFTAMAVAGNKSDISWSVASIPTVTATKPATAKDKKSKDAAAVALPARDAAAARAVQTPQAALDRITIPGDVREQIEDVMKPGSSFIISDNGLSNETGLFTDFIVPVR